MKIKFKHQALKNREKAMSTHTAKPNEGLFQEKLPVYITQFLVTIILVMGLGILLIFFTLFLFSEKAGSNEKPVITNSNKI